MKGSYSVMHGLFPQVATPLIYFNRTVHVISNLSLAHALFCMEKDNAYVNKQVSAVTC